MLLTLRRSMAEGQRIYTVDYTFAGLDGDLFSFPICQKPISGLTERDAAKVDAF